MELIKLTRVELFNEVWSAPFSQLANKYSFSDIGLRKICVRMEIPLPQRGHWSKAKFGKAPKKPKLPKSNNALEEVELRLRGQNKLYNPNESPLNARIRELEDSGINFQIDEELRKVDPLIKAVNKNLNAQKDYHGRLAKGIRFPNKGFLRVICSKEQQKRALLILDRIIKVLRLRGHSIEVVDSKTNAVIGSERIEVCVREIMKSVDTPNKRGYIDRSYEQSGRLSFRIEALFHKKQWEDRNSPLEDYILRIIAKLEVLAEQLKQERIENEERNRLYAIERKKAEEIKRTHEEELKATKDLFIQVERWKRVKEVDEFIKAMEKIKTKEWITWAKDKVDWYNPTVQKRDDILKDEDRKEIDDMFKPEVKTERRFGW